MTWQQRLPLPALDLAALHCIARAFVKVDSGFAATLAPCSLETPVWGARRAVTSESPQRQPA